MSDQDLLRGLERATWRVGATTNDDDLFALILEAAGDVGYDSASLMVYDRTLDALVVRAAKGADLLNTRLPAGPAISWRAMERRQPIVVQGPAGPDLPHTYTKDVPYSIVLPLLVGAKALGVLNVNRGAAPTASEVGYLRILAYQAAFAIERAGLYADLQLFAGQALSQEEESRRHIARELHDGLAPVIVSAYGILQNPGKTEVDVKRATDYLRRAIQETRAIIGSVRPATLEDLGLAGAISSAATEVAADAGWEIDEDIADIAPIRPDAEAALYRATVEALLNAKRHAGARRVTVKLRQDDAYLEIVVIDDGQGFSSEQWGEASAKEGHYGLLHMRERIGLLGGVCKIASKPGEGTTVRITVPRDRIS
ncbi:MAG: GAF domain-containing sensor histidine kinase [Chloroflexota bacterium]|nr:GAF domain-containing sensor histidine kinase [Chloroflexota bacterium]